MATPLYSHACKRGWVGDFSVWTHCQPVQNQGPICEKKGWGWGVGKPWWLCFVLSARKQIVNVVLCLAFVFFAYRYVLRD